MKPHLDPAGCPNRVDVTEFRDRHPRYMCGCPPNVVRVKGSYDKRTKTWFYSAECAQCGQYGSRVSASLFNIIMRKADEHARHGSTKGWKSATR